MIVPALLTDKKDDLCRMLEVCAQFTDYAQVDIMDGEFVPSRSVSLSDLSGLKSPLPCEGHLMVNDPLSWLESFKALGAERIVYHFEINKDHSQVIEAIGQAGFDCGLGINPKTQIDQFSHLVDKVSSLLFLSVEPGFYGAKFIPEVLEKIKEFKKLYPDKFIGIDGGIKLDNLAAVKSSGVDYVCVGSAILKAPDPASAYKDFLNLMNE